MTTTIVRHRENNGLFAVLGARGTGTWPGRSSTAGLHRSGLYLNESGSETVLVVCDRQGAIGSFPAKDLEVVSRSMAIPPQATRSPVRSRNFGDEPAAGLGE